MIARKLALSAAVAAVLALGAPTAALAADTAPDQTTSTTSSDDSNYTPTTPTEPTLAGSIAAGECVRNVPWITFSVVMTDPQNRAKDHTARLVLTKGSQSVTIPLGTLVDNKLSGRVLWPGASVDAKGNATSWPGWVQQNGQWVQTNDPQYYGWTRSGVSATIEVNPHLSVPLSYPPATAFCASPRDPAPASLAVTGLGVAVLPISLAGIAIVALGGTFLFLRRARRS